MKSLSELEKQLAEQKEFRDLMMNETPIVHDFNGKKMFFFKNSTWRDKYPFDDPIMREPAPEQFQPSFMTTEKKLIEAEKQLAAVEDPFKMPDGWRFYTMDSSVEGRSTVLIVRSGDKYKRWFELSENQQETISLYISGFGRTQMQALDNARHQAANDFSMESHYQI